MKRSRVERLKELWDDAWGFVRSEWDFGKFKELNDAQEKEAEEIFAELMAGWQPIETAPKDGSFVLLYCVDLDLQIQIGAWHDVHCYWEDIHEEQLFAKWTHWMPLPDPPKD